MSGGLAGLREAQVEVGRVGLGWWLVRVLDV